jgi:hypothetical protein
MKVKHLKILIKMLALVNLLPTSYVVPPPMGFNMQEIPKFVKEAEIKHGRVAMVSSLIIPFLDNVNPEILGVNYVNSLDISTQLSLLGIMGISEIAQMLKAYNFPDTVESWFNMKNEHIPGDYNFDPLKISNQKNISRLKHNEQFVGRLAMIGVACEMGKELLYQQPIF